MELVVADCGILCGSQTYIGVLATFIVLCLFAQNGEDDRGDSNNFIFKTLLKLTDDIVVFLSNKVKELKAEIRSIYDKSPGELQSNDPVNTLIAKHPEKEMDIKRNRLQTSLIQFKFATEAASKIDLIDFKPVKRQEELNYVALYTLFAIIMVMFVDCLDFVSLSYRRILINSMLALSTEFLIVLYHKYVSVIAHPLSDQVTESSDSVRHPVSWIMWLCMTAVLSSWIIFIIPNSISVLFTLISFFAVLAVGIWIFKGKWIRSHHKYNRYNRTFVISHFVYLATMSVIISLCLYYGEELLILSRASQENISLWVRTINLFADPEYTRVLIILFFTLNGFVLPFIVGWLPLRFERYRTERKLRQLQTEYKQLVAKYDEEFRAIQRGIE